MRTSEQLDALIPALVKAREKFRPVVRDATGQVGSSRTYKYADLAGVLDAVTPALSSAGLTLVQTLEPDTSTLLTRLYHVSGQWLESAYPLTLSGQTHQQIGSQISYGRRYSLLALLSVAQEDDDAATVPAHPPTKPVAPSAAPRHEAPPEVPPPAELPWVEGYVTGVEETAGTKKNGDPWTRYRVSFDGGSNRASTFSVRLGAVAREAQEAGLPVRYRCKVEPKGTALVDLVIVTMTEEADDERVPF